MGLHHALEIFVGGLDSLLFDVNPSIVDQNVDAAMRVGDAVDQRLGLIELGDVVDLIAGRVAEGGDGFAQFFFTTPNDDNFCSSLHKAGGNAKAQPCATASD